ncbi:MAG TPA: hypothetical protein VFY93_18350 [Planctomycetota bacterium]|nr:hypothetical protein [Planctomycetota bacterium]
MDVPRNRAAPAVLLLVSGCASHALAPQPDSRERTAQVTFEGLVMERLPSAGAWCGVAATFQGVRYRVDTVESGPMEPGQQVVYHALVGPPLCERDAPVLSREIFRVGQRLRVECERTAKGEFVAWERAESVQVRAGEVPWD